MVSFMRKVWRMKHEVKLGDCTINLLDMSLPNKNGVIYSDDVINDMINVIENETIPLRFESQDTEKSYNEFIESIKQEIYQNTSVSFEILSGDKE